MTPVRRHIVSLLAIVVGMFGLAFASVPLYSLFCKVTGYGGTPRQVTQLSMVQGTREFTVRFNADIDPTLAWKFMPEQPSVTVRPGKQTLIFYRAENLSDVPITGRAVYNVTPHQAGTYFSKIECFCFTEQTLAPHEVVEMPVSFFIDPAIEQDPDLKRADTITLSYTFFRVEKR